MKSIFYDDRAGSVLQFSQSFVNLPGPSLNLVCKPWLLEMFRNNTGKRIIRQISTKKASTLFSRISLVVPYDFL